MATASEAAVAAVRMPTIAELLCAARDVLALVPPESLGVTYDRLEAAVAPWAPGAATPTVLHEQRDDGWARLAIIGDDGTVLAAPGHVDARLMVCMAVGTFAEVHGPVEAIGELIDASDFNPGALVDVVTHCWAIQRPVEPGSAEQALWWRDPDTGDRITAGTPGAVPVTLFDVEG